MKKNSILLLTFLSLLFGCQNATKKSGSNPSSPDLNSGQDVDSISVSSDQIKICHFKAGENRCHVSDRIYRKLIQLSQSGVMTMRVLDLNEIRQQYALNDQMVQCLKNQHCTEEAK